MKHHYILCVRNEGFEVSLELRKLYEAIPDQSAGIHGQVRIIDESGQDYLYPKDLFMEIHIPLEVANALSHSA
jgi:hypothetical protein